MLTLHRWAQLLARTRVRNSRACARKDKVLQRRHTGSMPPTGSMAKNEIPFAETMCGVKNAITSKCHYEFECDLVILKTNTTVARMVVLRQLRTVDA